MISVGWLGRGNSLGPRRVSPKDAPLHLPPWVRLKGHGIITRVAFSPDGKQLATLDKEGNIAIWDVPTAKFLRYILTEGDLEPSLLAYSPDGRILAGAGKNTNKAGWPQEVQLGEVATGKLLHTLNWHADVVFDLDFSPDSKLLAASGGTSATLWNLATEKKLMNCKQPLPAWFLILDSKHCLAVCWDGKEHSFVAQEMSSGRRLYTPKNTKDIFRSSLSRNRREFITLHADGSIRRWDTWSGKLLSLTKHPPLPDRELFEMTFNQEFSHAVVCSPRDGCWSLWDVGKGKFIRTLVPRTKDFTRRNQHRTKAFSPDGRWLAVSVMGPDVDIWDMVGLAK